MVEKTEKRSGFPLRMAMRAVPALMCCTVLMGSPVAFAQSTGNQANGQAADTTDPLDLPESTIPGATAAGGTTSQQNATDGTNATTPLGGDTALRLNGTEDTDPDKTGSILDQDMRRLNLREQPLDDRRSLPRALDMSQPVGIRLGSFILRSTSTETINSENKTTGGTKENRVFGETDFRTTLSSDWARHALTITAEGQWQKNLSGSAEEQPAFNLDGDLRLDLPAETVAHVTGGYQFYREDTDDPNAISSASKQSDVQRVYGGLSVDRDFGLLRGLVSADLSRLVYSDAELSDGTRVTLSDRNQTSGTLRGRVGYEMSPALTPFLEASIGRALYDDDQDSQGYARSSHTYGAKAGVEVDLGEKLRGEIGFGYKTSEFEDARLASIDAATVDAAINWSPHRGTDVSLGLATTIDPSTTAGESGYVSRQLSATLTQQVREDLIARMIGTTTFRDYPSGSVNSDETAYTASAGLTWSVNRYLDLTTNLGYELTSRKESADTHQLRAGVGLSLKQ